MTGAVSKSDVAEALIRIHTRIQRPETAHVIFSFGSCSMYAPSVLAGVFYFWLS
jgi:hypothetical protein